MIKKTCASIVKNVMENRGATWAKREGKQPGRQVDVLFLRSVSILSGAFCMFFEPGKVKWMERKIKNRSTDRTV